MAATATPRLDRTEARLAARGLAIFDLDRTVVAGSSLAMFGRAVVAAGIVRRRVLTRNLLAEVRYRHRGLGTETLERIAARLLRSAEQLRVDDLQAVARQVAPEVAARAYPGARALLRQHQRAGDVTVLLSASPEPLVAEIAAALGFDVAVGTGIEVCQGRLTGRLDGLMCHGPGKLVRLGQAFTAVDLASCVAYADAESDLPLLRAVGTAVAVNPDRGLRAAARAAGWPVFRLA